MLLVHGQGLFLLSPVMTGIVGTKGIRLAEKRAFRGLLRSGNSRREWRGNAASRDRSRLTAGRRCPVQPAHDVVGDTTCRTSRLRDAPKTFDEVVRHRSNGGIGRRCR